MYLCTRSENYASKTCRVPYDVERSAEFEYNAQIEVNPNNRYELLPQIIGAKGPIRPTNGKGIELFQPKMPPTLSFYGMYQKPFIYRRNRTNPQ